MTWTPSSHPWLNICKEDELKGYEMREWTENGYCNLSNQEISVGGLPLISDRHGRFLDNYIITYGFGLNISTLDVIHGFYMVANYVGLLSLKSISITLERVLITIE